MIDPKNIDWKNLTFSHTPTRSMFTATCKKGGTKWEIQGLQPFGDLKISPAAGVLHYGQGIFEGMKAYSTPDKRILIFRPLENAKRMAKGCERLCMPAVPEDLFLKSVRDIVKDNLDYVPPYIEGMDAQPSLYIRPVVLGTGPVIGVAPAPEYTFLIFVSPVGPYFKSGFKPIRLQTNIDYHRAAPRGTGNVKAIGNYAASLLPGTLAKSQHYSEVLYLDSSENKYLNEVGAANVFCIRKGILLTPGLESSILPGITRDSVIQLSKKVFNIPVEERNVSIDEMMESEEAFGTGTAAVITPIGSVTHNGKEHALGDGGVGKITRMIYDELTSIQHGRKKDTFGWTEEVARRS